MKTIAKEIDIKSFLIGFLLAMVILMSIGAGPASSGTQDVRIVDIDTYDALRVELYEVKSSLEVPVKIEDVGYSVKVPVVIKEQPVTVNTR